MKDDRVRILLSEVKARCNQAIADTLDGGDLPEQVLGMDIGMQLTVNNVLDPFVENIMSELFGWSGPGGRIAWME